MNLSIRSPAGTGADTLIVGFNLAGTGSTPLLIRGIGPGLTPFGVGGVLADPTLRLDAAGGTMIAENDNWGTGNAAIASTAASIGAFALSAGGRDAAILQTLNVGSYTAQIGGGTGTALVEVYDSGTGATMRLINVSARARSGSGSDTIIAGFAIGGSGQTRLLIRGIGPALAPLGVPNALTDPKLEIYTGTTKINENDNWNAADATVFNSVGAFALPANSRDAAMVVSLRAGSYTAQVSSAANTGGVALIEVYEITDPQISREVELFATEASASGGFFRVASGTGSATTLGTSRFSPGLDFRGNGVLYGCSSSLVIISPTNGTSSVVGSLPDLLTSIAFSPDDALYGLSNDGLTLYRIDPATGRSLQSITLSGTTHSSGSSFPGEINGIDFGPDGTLYGIGFSLYTINVDTGVASKITPAREVSGDLFRDLDMGSDGKLRSVTATGSTSNLYVIDPKTGLGQLAGPTGATLTGLASR